MPPSDATAESTMRPQEPSATQTPKVDDTVQPQVTSDPTKRPESSSAVGSYEPSRTAGGAVEPSATQTPRVEDTTDASQSAPFTPRPTVRPLPTADLVWAGNVIRTILPSFAPTKLPPVRMSVMPSPWRPARNITIAVEDRPPYIASQIKFPGANATAFQTPEKFQEIQMSLACTLRLPLEKIRLTNITLTDARGLKTIIDATQFMLSSNGTVGCFKLERNVTASTRTGLRRLQATGGSQAQVDYYIVEPPTEILALTPAEFSSVMETSAAMAEVSASVGSTGVQAVTEASLAAAPNSGSAPAASSGSVSGNSPSNGVIIGGAIGGVLFAIVVVSAFVGFSQMRKRAARATNLTHRVSGSGSVQVVHLNPIPGNPRLSPPGNTWARVASQRGPVAFEAQKTRSSV